jgi:hypothetical protein
MVGIVLRVRHNVAGKNPRHIVLKVDYRIHETVEETGGQQQVAVIGKNGRFSEQAAAQGYTRRIKLRQMHLDHVVLRYQPGGDPAKGRRDDAFADTHHDGNPEDFHAIHAFPARQGRVILCSHDGDLMTAFGEGTCQPFGIDCETTGMRTVIGKYCEDFHAGTAADFTPSRA